MKTEKHPYSKVIHYSMGGVITAEKAEFKTMCGKKFRQGHSAIMDSGYFGAQRVTCKNCRAHLNLIKTIEERVKKIRAKAEKQIEVLYKKYFKIK